MLLLHCLCKLLKMVVIFAYSGHARPRSPSATPLPHSLQCRRPPQPQDQPVQVVRLHTARLRGEGVLQQLQPQFLLRGPLRDLRGHMVSGNPLVKGAHGEKKGVCRVTAHGNTQVCTSALELLPIKIIQGFLFLPI